MLSIEIKKERVSGKATPHPNGVDFYGRIGQRSKFLDWITKQDICVH
jgi:hypothetical protein